MYGLAELKREIFVGQTQVACPVGACDRRVPRQRRSFRRAPQFLCPDHGIYISPSAFEYEDESDNLLWRDAQDLALLEAIKREKRECRMARDNSEDAVTWNVFRYFERLGTLASLLSALLGVSISDPQLIYWSYSQAENGSWRPLTIARSEFGERDQRGSEPDLIAVSNEALIWIEAKVGALNRTMPSNPGYSLPAYAAGGQGWFREAFGSDPYTVAIHAQLYELMRFWLLGSWTAAQLGRPFYLISLVLERQEPDLVARIAPHLHQTASRSYRKLAWEEIYGHLLKQVWVTPEQDRLLRYFENKAVGYRGGVLQAGFAVPHR